MFTSPIKTTEDSLELVGGKGRSLARMASAGFAVPGGFLVTADAYREFVADNDLQSTILDMARPELKDGYPSFESSAEKIRRARSRWANGRSVLSAASPPRRQTRKVTGISPKR